MQTRSHSQTQSQSQLHNPILKHNHNHTHKRSHNHNHNNNNNNNNNNNKQAAQLLVTVSRTLLANRMAVQAQVVLLDAIFVCESANDKAAVWSLVGSAQLRQGHIPQVITSSSSHCHNSGYDRPCNIE